MAGILRDVVKRPKRMPTDSAVTLLTERVAALRLANDDRRGDKRDYRRRMSDAISTIEECVGRPFPELWKVANENAPYIIGADLDELFAHVPRIKGWIERMDSLLDGRANDPSLSAAELTGLRREADRCPRLDFFQFGWKHFADILAADFVNAMLSANEGRFGRATQGPVCNYLSKVIPYVTGEVVKRTTIGRFLNGDALKLWAGRRLPARLEERIECFEEEVTLPV